MIDESHNPDINPDNNENEERKPITNPVVYLKKFREDELYQKAFVNFKSGKSFTEEYPDEMRDLFEDNEKGRQALIQFARNGTMLVYERSLYSNAKENNPIDDYFSLIKDYRHHPENYDALGYDTTRGSYHDRATKFISEKFNLPKTLSIGMVQIMAINKGLESFGQASNDRIQAISRTL
jgi:hypothetical protein